jgi:hypothetical protein
MAKFVYGLSRMVHDSEGAGPLRCKNDQFNEPYRSSTGVPLLPQIFRMGQSGVYPLSGVLQLTRDQDGIWFITISQFHATPNRLPCTTQ